MIAGIITEMPTRFRDVFTELVGMASGGQISFRTPGDADPAGERFKTCHFQINLAYSTDVRTYALHKRFDIKFFLFFVLARPFPEGSSIKDRAPPYQEEDHQLSPALYSCQQ